MSEYIKRVFAQAHKPRAYLPLIRGYMNVAHYDTDFSVQMYEVVSKGLNESDYDRVRPFFVLFEFLLLDEAAEWHKAHADQWLRHFF